MCVCHGKKAKVRNVCEKTENSFRGRSCHLKLLTCRVDYLTFLYSPVDEVRVAAEHGTARICAFPGPRGREGSVRV